MRELAKVYETEAERGTRLAELGLTEHELRDAVSFGVSEASRCTENDPRMARGWIRWAKTIRALRETLTTKGWRRREHLNYPTVVNSDGNVAVTASSGDENTGTKEPPHTTRPKGEATKKVITKNQGQFADVHPDFPRTADEPEEEPDQTWLLLFREDEEVGETRLELSLPIRMEADGYVTTWRERILLEPIGTRRTPLPTADEEGEAIDVEVRRREA